MRLVEHPLPEKSQAKNGAMFIEIPLIESRNLFHGAIVT